MNRKGIFVRLLGNPDAGFHIDWAAVEAHRRSHPSEAGVPAIFSLNIPYDNSVLFPVVIATQIRRDPVPPSTV